tara:strand:- start:6042 stop:6740 length:699 start_codon:yes stop_codon:yes gene_type:complete
MNRHEVTTESVTSIVASLITAPPIVLKIVEELVQQELPRHQTVVGEQLKIRVQKDLAAVTAQPRKLEKQRTTEAKQARHGRADLKEKHRKAIEESTRIAMDTMEKLGQQLVHEQEAEKARKKRIESEENYRKAAENSNRTTKDAIEKLEEQLKSEQRARHAVLMEEEVKATEEREEGKTLLKQAIDRQHHMHKHSAQSHTTAQVHTIPSPSRRSLWFQHPGYELLDWPAWLS